MKSKKFLLGLFLGFVVLTTLTGCGNKTVKSTNDFKSVAEKHSYRVADVTSQFASYGYISEATVAQSSDGWQVEFYVLSDNGTATSMFNTNKSLFEQEKGSAATETSLNNKNSSSYSLTSGGYYMHLCRVDNTLLYAKVSDSYKDDVKAFIKEFGY